MASLEGIKVGDLLFVPLQFGRTGRIIRVEKETPTQLISGSQRYRRKDGKLVGSSGWETTYARLATEQDLLDARIQKAEYKLAKVKLTAETLDAAENLIKASETKGA